MFSKPQLSHFRKSLNLSKQGMGQQIKEILKWNLCGNSGKYYRCPSQPHCLANVFFFAFKLVNTPFVILMDQIHTETDAGSENAPQVHSSSYRRGRQRQLF